MQTIRLTSIDFKRSDWNSSTYAGRYDVSNCDGNIEIDANLGVVRFPVLRTRGAITALYGTSIKADGVIEAGAGIRSGWDIQAGAAIRAGKGIDAGGEIKAGEDIRAGWQLNAGQSITAGKGVKAGTNIKAGTGVDAGGAVEAGAGIKAGWRIRAANDIAAGEGLEAGLSVECDGVLRVKLRVFAGLCLWRVPTEAEKRIVCARFEGGSIAYGTLVERAAHAGGSAPHQARV